LMSPWRMRNKPAATRNNARHALLNAWAGRLPQRQCRGVATTLDALDASFAVVSRAWDEVLTGQDLRPGAIHELHGPFGRTGDQQQQ